DSIVESMFEIGQLEDGNRVLDVMAGDGNLAERLDSFARRRRIGLEGLDILEFSRVQCEIAKQRKFHTPSRVLWADLIQLRNLVDSSRVETGCYDRIFLKSAVHEIPQEEQLALYENLYKLLADNGLLIQLGFLFDDPDERDEFREITRVKDSLAGLPSMVERRYFATRSEFHNVLNKVGFGSPVKSQPVTYQLRSWVASAQYFGGDDSDSLHYRKEYAAAKAKELELHASQAQALYLRRAGKIVFHSDRTTMYMPGEITVLQKRPSHGGRKGIYEQYPYEFLRNLKAHRELLDQIEGAVSQGSTVADLGCGPGLLFERLQKKTKFYLGVDTSGEFLDRAQTRLSPDTDKETVRFVQGDLNNLTLNRKSYDTVILSNVLYQENVDAVPLLRKAIEAVKPGGKIVVSGPLSDESFRNIEGKMREDLEAEGYLPQFEETFQQISQANARLLTKKGNYWSTEGMVALLSELGVRSFETVDSNLYYGSGFFIVGRVG
ncbi:methyltransferase domain-containing protein, partial [bacterium]|nr:methyltransferase domain-containing protein [bacterium]